MSFCLKSRLRSFSLYLLCLDSFRFRIAFLGVQRQANGRCLSNFSKSLFMLHFSRKLVEITHVSNHFRSPITWLGIFTGYYVVLIAECVACMFHPFSVLTAASFLLASCMYINGMLEDLVDQIERIEVESLPQTEFQKQLLDGIRYHEEIIEYGPSFNFESILFFILIKLSRNGLCHLTWSIFQAD